MLPYVMAAYQNCKPDATQYTPSYLLMGCEVRVHLDLVCGTGIYEESLNSEYTT